MSLSGDGLEEDERWTKHHVLSCFVGFAVAWRLLRDLSLPVACGALGLKKYGRQTGLWAVPCCLGCGDGGAIAVVWHLLRTLSLPAAGAIGLEEYGRQTGLWAVPGCLGFVVVGGVAVVWHLFRYLSLPAAGAVGLEEYGRQTETRGVVPDCGVVGVVEVVFGCALALLGGAPACVPQALG